MQKFLNILLVVVALGGAWYFFERIEEVCPAPLQYRLGELDASFNLSPEEAREAIEDAAALWEEEMERDLFVYDEQADFSVNFVFDDRQKRSDEETAALATLEIEAKKVTEAKETYDDLAASLLEEQETFALNKENYEADLAAYNKKVQTYNEAGGAPKKEYEALEVERKRLDRVAARLETAVEEMNTFTKEVNEAGEQHNGLINTYNEQVQAFNRQYGDEREFTQGDYLPDRINIYTFKDGAELRLVLAHELGHALSLGHVEDPAAVMHYLLGAKAHDFDVTEADVTEFARVCGADITLWEKFKMVILRGGEIKGAV